MKLKNIEKKLEGKFIHRYDLTYETEDGGKKVYEMIAVAEKTVMDTMKHINHQGSNQRQEGLDE